MATIKDFYPYVMPNVQGCPLSLVDNAIRSSIIDFCERTQMWKVMIDPIDIVDGTSTYSITVPAALDAVIVKPTFVSVEDRPLTVTNEEDLDSLIYGWRESEAIRPLLYYMDYNTDITLVPQPSEGLVDGLKVEVSLKPEITSNTCPDWLMQNWIETIAHGALMRLHSMPGKVWADTQTVGYHRSRYRDGVSRAKSRTMKSFARQGKTVQPRSFWE